jgi:TolB protein
MRKILLAALFSLPATALASLEITVTGGEQAATPIAIVPFSAPADVGTDFAEIVAADLERSGLFQPMNPKDMLERPTDIAQVNYRNWRAVAVDNVVIGQVRRTGSTLKVHFELLDVLRAQGLIAYDVPVVDARHMRPVGHQIADLIYQKLTGVPGYFNSQIAYVTATGQKNNMVYQVFVADSDGKNELPVSTSREPLMSPSWSPDGRQLAYVGYEHGRSAIYLHRLDTGELRRISAEKGINGAPAWSPDGKQLAVTLSFERNPDIYIIDLASGARRQITSHFAIDTEPSWSPDGRQIAFTSDRGGQPQVYVVPSSGGDARRVTFEGKQNSGPRFSPDGKSLVLVNVDDRNVGRVAILDLATRSMRILGEGPLDESPSFAPNGAAIIYSARGRQGNELATVTVDGRIRSRLAQTGNVKGPAWSPIRQ